VKTFGVGTVRFFGPHHVDGKNRCGVELDEYIGLNDGTIKGHKYFECEPKRGVLVDPRQVLMIDDLPEDGPDKANDTGYLAMNPEES